MSDLHELLYSHEEGIQTMARHARKTKDPQEFVVAVLDLLDHAGRSLAVARLGSEAVDHYLTQSLRRHISPIKVTDVTVAEIDRIASEHPSWLSRNKESLNDLCVHVVAVGFGDLFYSSLFVPEN